jgi:hypothetical protein
MNRWFPLTLGAAVALLAGSGQAQQTPQPPAPPTSISFPMVVSAGAKPCLPYASGYVTIKTDGEAENLSLYVTGLPRNTGFDFFVIQVPNAPFGLSWYQGDVETDDNGVGQQNFRGRFNIETFIVAPGAAPAPKVFDDNATTNPATPPVQIYHLGLWFNSPDDAQKAGCPATVTPFNGEHHAGIQVLNTSNFPDGAGPLRGLE